MTSRHNEYTASLNIDNLLWPLTMIMIMIYYYEFFLHTIIQKVAVWVTIDDPLLNL